MAHSSELHGGWHLLLQHPSITQQQQLVCSLLRTSRSLQTALHSAAAGQILCRVTSCNELAPSKVITPAHLTHSSAQLVTASTAASFQLWLKQHSRLLHTLDLGPWLDGDNAAATADACAEGLASAAAAAEAAGQPGLQLQGFRGPWKEAVLQQLPAATLTYLSITEVLVHPEDMEESYGSPSFDQVAQLKCRMFARFTNLRHLSIVDEDSCCSTANVSGLLPALHGMTKLTFLEMGISRGVERFMRHLPPSLQVLRMGVESGGYCLETDESDDEEGDFYRRWPEPVDLSHLTSVTKLDTYMECPFMVQKGDVLPPNVLELNTSWVLDWGPLLRLTSLRKLSLSLGDEDELTTERADMLRVHLTNLNSVEISHGNRLTEELIRTYTLPLHSLQNVPVNASAVPAVAPHLRSLTSVTSLQLGVEGQHGSQAGTWRYLAQGLTPLTQLLDLDLKGPSLEDIPGGGRLAYEGTAAASVPLGRAVAGMHALQGLKLFPVCLSAEAVVVLAEATALTRLELRHTGVDDFGVNSLVVNLPALQVFDVSENGAVTNAVMPVIAAHLRELRCFRLEHTRVDALGLHCLTSLRHLQEVRVCKRLVPAAQRAVGPLSTVVFDVEEYYCKECWLVALSVVAGQGQAICTGGG